MLCVLPCEMSVLLEVSSLFFRLGLCLTFFHQGDVNWNTVSRWDGVFCWLMVEVPTVWELVVDRVYLISWLLLMIQGSVGGAVKIPPSSQILVMVEPSAEVPFQLPGPASSCEDAKGSFPQPPGLCGTWLGLVGRDVP